MNSEFVLFAVMLTVKRKMHR